MQRESASRGFLDVSEYVLKEYSPMFKPSVAPKEQSREIFEATPEIEPIDQDTTKFTFTPLHLGRTHNPREELLKDDDEFFLEIKQKKRSFRPRSNSLYLNNNEDSLDKIIEESDNYNHSLGQDYDQSYSSEYSQVENSENFNFSHENHPESEPSVEYVNVYTEIVKKFYSETPADINEIIAKKINNEEELELVRNEIYSFLFEFEQSSFSEAWKQLSGSLEHKTTLIRAGVKKTFLKKVGCLSFSQRRKKIVIYLEKKKRRRERKKLLSTIAKRMTDTRLRLKGKFVTKKQICEKLGLPTISGLSNDKIREMLEGKQGLFETEA